MALLIDADILAYQAVSATQNEFEFEPDEWHLTCDIAEARKVFNDSLDGLVPPKMGNDYRLCFSDPDKQNFRKQLNPDYKATRAQRKPVGYWPFVRKLHEDFKDKVRFLPRLEADDVIGYLASRDVGQHVIWSIDKDLKQIPGSHLIDGEIVEINEVDADINFLTQVLTGDQADNYPGCPGIGPVKASTLLQKAINAEAHLCGTAVHCCWPSVVKAYITAGLTEDDAILQARMAFLLRHENYNLRSGKIKLWKPPTKT